MPIYKHNVAGLAKLRIGNILDANIIKGIILPLMAIGSFYERNSVVFKVLACAFLIFLLMIPKWMIEDVVFERAQRQTVAVNEVTSKWGEATVVTGPILTIPFEIQTTTFVTEVDANMISRSVPRTQIDTRYFHILPETVDYKTNLNPNIRSRGIFDVVVYQQSTKVSGTFELPKIEIPGVSEDKIKFDKAFLSVGLSDLKGIENALTLNWNGILENFEPGLLSKDVLTTGVSTPIRISSTNMTNTFEIDLNLRGAQSVKFIPVGKTTTASVESSWKNPSFDGAFLPSERTITDSGFNAKWKVLHFNRDFPQSWVNQSYRLGYIPQTQNYTPDQLWNQYGSYDVARKAEMASSDLSQNIGNIGNYAFGVNLITPVDNYNKTERTVKYAILIIGLSFLSYFLMEVVRRRPIHIIQYLLVGFALCIFYLLLLSMSEHISFNLAYGIASLLTIGLITLYTWAMFGERRLTLFVGSILVILYGFVFVILQSEDYALLIGTVGVFTILATVMYTTRNIDWYNISKPKN